MEIKTQQSTDGVIITMTGIFDFRARTQFRDAFKNVPKDTAFVLDFSSVETMDSSGIGMLLMLREHAGHTDANITILYCTPLVKEILQAAKLDRLFNIP